MTNKGVAISHYAFIFLLLTYCLYAILFITNEEYSMYTIKQLSKERFEIASFDDYKEPTSIYYINAKRCSCPARNPCKHQKIVNAFKELEHGAWGFEFIGTEVQPFSLRLMEI
jgi:hypothetical protein